MTVKRKIPPEVEAYIREMTLLSTIYKALDPFIAGFLTDYSGEILQLGDLVVMESPGRGRMDLVVNRLEYVLESFTDDDVVRNLAFKLIGEIMHTDRPGAFAVKIIIDHGKVMAIFGVEKWKGKP